MALASQEKDGSYRDLHFLVVEDAIPVTTSSKLILK